MALANSICVMGLFSGDMIFISLNNSSIALSATGFLFLLRVRPSSRLIFFALSEALLEFCSRDLCGEAGSTLIVMELKFDGLSIVHILMIEADISVAVSLLMISAREYDVTDSLKTRIFCLHHQDYTMVYSTSRQCLAS